MWTATKITIIAAGLAAGLMFGAPAGHASSDAPWCAVINLGMDARWDCRYRTVEECVPNVERGSCSPNPYAGVSAGVAVPEKRHVKHRSNVTE
jgi:hypothetical protein